MTPEQAELAHDGLLIAAAHLSGDDSSEDQLLSPFQAEDRFSRLADVFIGATILVNEILATGLARSFEDTLRSLHQDTEILLLPGLPIGPWDEALRLTVEVEEGQDEPPSSSIMDIPSAINVTFQLLISALTDVTTMPHFRHMTLQAMAEWLAQAIEDGRANG